VAIRIRDQIVANGKVDHARLGVVVQEVNQTLADSFKLDRPKGRWCPASRRAARPSAPACSPAT
jgi:S1-C subfamily serine protease